MRLYERVMLGVGGAFVLTTIMSIGAIAIARIICWTAGFPIDPKILFEVGCTGAILGFMGCAVGAIVWSATR